MTALVKAGVHVQARVSPEAVDAGAGSQTNPFQRHAHKLHCGVLCTLLNAVMALLQAIDTVQGVNAMHCLRGVSEECECG